MRQSKEFAYIIGLAIGDGNISNPNGRAYRLRITCDSKYPEIIKYAIFCLKILFPKNKVSLVNKKQTSFDISVYNKNINEIFGWKMENGKKINQKIKIPLWINSKKIYIKYFIRGLFESDGSIYKDRKYVMVNFVSYNKEIIDYLKCNLINLNFQPALSKHKEKNGIRYTIRIAKNSLKMIQYFKINKK